MSFARALVLWIVMLAVPFQGYAAAAMVFCENGSPSPASSLNVTHDHASHDHAAAENASANQHVGLPADEVQSEGQEVLTGTIGLLDPSHACGTCGTCGPCHAVALITMFLAIEGYSLPQAYLAEPSAALATVSLSVLDKPPRK